MLVLLLISTLGLAFNIQPVKASGTIYIRADGSIDPPTANITSTDNVTYTFINNIASDADGIVVERSNIVIDGAGYTLQGSGNGYGCYLPDVSNVTVRNTNITGFQTDVFANRLLSSDLTLALFGNNIAAVRLYCYSAVFTGNNITDISLEYCDQVDIVGNNITSIGLWYCDRGQVDIIENALGGVWGLQSDVNIRQNNVTGDISVSGYLACHAYISQNNITGSVSVGGEMSGADIIENNLKSGVTIFSYGSANICGNDIEGGITAQDYSTISISANNITTNHSGIGISAYTAAGDIYENNIRENDVGISLKGEYIPTFHFHVYHNNFINNTHQVSNDTTPGLPWDDGYPSGGNYWSDYNGTDLLRGVCQNETGSDGIGDVSYLIDENNTDNYPLMKPYAGLHDIGITSLTTSKTIVGQGYTASISLKVINYGINPETFNVTFYANKSSIAEFTVFYVSERNSLNFTFNWNTAGFAYGNYTVNAYAWPVQGETDTKDNTLVDGVIYVGIPGDLNADGAVDVFDAVTLSGAAGSTPGDVNWNPNADINNDEIVDLFDAVILSGHAGETET